MNFKELADNLGLEEDEYLELIELFIETGMSDLDKLGSAIEKGDAEESANAAHSIKGASGNLGLMDVYEIAMKIEQDARNGLLEGLSEPIEAIKGKLDVISQSAKG